MQSPDDIWVKPPEKDASMKYKEIKARHLAGAIFEYSSLNEVVGAYQADVRQLLFEMERMRETVDYFKSSRHYAQQNYEHMNEYAAFLRSVIRSGEKLPDDFTFTTFMKKHAL